MSNSFNFKHPLFFTDQRLEDLLSVDFVVVSFRRLLLDSTEVHIFIDITVTEIIVLYHISNISITLKLIAANFIFSFIAKAEFAWSPEEKTAT